MSQTLACMMWFREDGSSSPTASNIKERYNRDCKDMAMTDKEFRTTGCS